MTGFDEHLIAQMALGDGEAFAKLYHATSDMVYGYALSILKNAADAEDVMHDAYILMYQKAASYQAMGKPAAWMLTIVRNLCFNKMQSHKRIADVDAQEHAASVDEAQGSLDRIVLDKALAILDLQERQIVVLHALTGMKHREIAELLELPIGTVLSKYHRALKRLKGELEGMGELR